MRKRELQLISALFSLKRQLNLRLRKTGEGHGKAEVFAVRNFRYIEGFFHISDYETHLLYQGLH